MMKTGMRKKAMKVSAPNKTLKEIKPESPLEMSIRYLDLEGVVHKRSG